MKRLTRELVVVTFVVCGVSAGVRAADQPSSAPAASAAAPVEQGMTTEGSIAILDLKSPTPTLRVRSATGSSWTLAIEPKTTVWENGQAAKVEQLQVGQWVKVRHAVSEGKDVAKSIEVAKAPAASSAATPAASKSY